MSDDTKTHWSSGEPKSELEQLLEKHTKTWWGLNKKDYCHAIELIYTAPVYSEQDCNDCLEGNKAKAIYDTGLCQCHARSVLLKSKNSSKYF